MIGDYYFKVVKLQNLLHPFFLWFDWSPIKNPKFHFAWSLGFLNFMRETYILKVITGLTA
jgi:hypothetical protein